MNFSENELESVLRRAPVPPPPATLEAELVRSLPRMPRNGLRPAMVPALKVESRPLGLRRWWPALLPGIAVAALAAGLLVQTREVAPLRQRVAGAESRLASAGGSQGDDPADPGAARQVTNPDSENERRDLARLRELVVALRQDVEAAERVAGEAAALKSALGRFQALLPAEQREAIVQQERAAAIQCLNHLKRLGLAVRIFANDNGDDFPPDITSMTNEIVSPVVLVCPTDEQRQPARDWASFTPAHCSYEFLSPGPGKFEVEPLRLMWRCPIHGNIALCDGSAFLEVAKNQPGRIESRNGALYLVPDNPCPSPASEPRGGSDGLAPTAAGVGDRPIQATESALKGAALLEARYGLAPGSITVVAPSDPGTNQGSGLPARAMIGVTEIPAPTPQP